MKSSSLQQRIHVRFRELLVLVLVLISRSGSAAELDPLDLVWSGTSQAVRDFILRTADLPGGEVVRPLADAPIMVWCERGFLGSDNVYADESNRYCVLRLMIGNQTDHDIQVTSDSIELKVGETRFKIGAASKMSRQMPLEIDWHEDGNTRPQFQLRTPQKLNIPQGKAVAFWCVFAGFEPIPVVPPMLLSIRTETGEVVNLDVIQQQNARLGLKTAEIGPQKSLVILSIMGQLNRFNCAYLASEMKALSQNGGKRFLVEWGPDAQPSDDVLIGWLLSMNAASREGNPLEMQLPVLPASRQVVLANLTDGNREVEDWADETQGVYRESRVGAIAALRDVFERVDSSTIEQELANGHTWSQEAAMIVGGERLDPKAIPLLIELSHSANPDLQAAAAIALGEQSSPLAANRLQEMVKSQNTDLTRAAFRGLLQTPTPAHRTNVLAMLAQGTVRLPGPEIFRLLADNYHPDWQTYLAAGVNDPDAKNREAALEVLYQIGHPQLDRMCQIALSDPEEAVRVQSFRILMDRTDRASLEAASQYSLAELSQGKITPQILEHVDRTRDSRAASALLVELEKLNGSRHRLIEVIGAIGTEKHLEAVVASVGKYSDDEQVIVVSLLPRLSLDLQLKVLGDLAASPVASVRYAAVGNLKSIGNEEALTILGRMLENEANEGDPLVVCVAMGEIGTEGAIRRLRSYQEKVIQAQDNNGIAAVDQAFKAWRSRFPGYSFVESGFAYVSAEDEEQALKAFSMAIMINPELADAYSSRGNVYLRRNEFEKADVDFRKAMKLDIHDGQALTGVAIVAAIIGDWESAVSMVEVNAPRFRTDRFYSYNSACVYSRCVERLRQSTDSPDVKEKIANFEKLAIERLQESITRGFSQFEWMKEDPDLSAIRDLPAFHQLEEME
ncbi:HEAT repeat domain-containing protein [Planctomicrobium sp. SH668]|uniref:HEAT repeat domain-containing protein n=1 Tax=Planctomicrobium sp. SH668 TaxID=3448126 RepID=UPI003F5BE8FA